MCIWDKSGKGERLWAGPDVTGMYVEPDCPKWVNVSSSSPLEDRANGMHDRLRLIAQPSNTVDRTVFELWLGA